MTEGLLAASTTVGLEVFGEVELTFASTPPLADLVMRERAFLAITVAALITFARRGERLRMSSEIRTTVIA